MKYLLLIIILTSCVGPTGQKGSQGDVGQTGLNGSGCNILPMIANASWPNGGFYVICGTTSAFISNGAEGTAGNNGVDGQKGDKGDPGDQGIPGVAGTRIIPIQFCVGFTPTYPYVFPEAGLIIDGIVYGVYSANDGFLAPLPPGVYMSNGINASCTFTINPDGSISQ